MIIEPAAAKLSQSSPTPAESADISTLFDKMALGEGKHDAYVQAFSQYGDAAQAHAVRRRRPLDAPYALAVAGQSPGGVKRIREAKSPGRVALQCIQSMLSGHPRVWTASAGIPLRPLVGMYVGLEAGRRADLRTLAGGEMLVAAVALGDAETVEALLQDGVERHGVDAYGNTALHWAVMTDQTELANRLRRAGASESHQNVFFATPSDYLPRFGPEIPVAAYVQPLGAKSDTPMPASQVHATLGFYIVEQSRLGADWFAQMALTAFDRSLAPEVCKEIPKNALPALHRPVLRLKASSTTGWGVHAREAMPANTYLGSYTGDVIHKAESQLREKRFGLLSYNEQLFEFRSQQMLAHCLPFSIDAEFAGDLPTRFNSTHASGIGNVKIRDGFRAGRPVVDYFTKQAVREGEQLVWYYGAGYWQAANAIPKELTIEDGFFGAPEESSPDDGTSNGAAEGEHRSSR